MEKELKNQAKMEVLKTSEENKQKLTYEQLNTVCMELHQQNQRLVAELRQVNAVNMFKRLDYLFMVLQYKSAFKDEAFVDSCIQEIKEAIILEPDEESKEE